MLDAIAVCDDRVSILTLVRHCLSRSSEPGSRQFVVYSVSEGDQLTLSEVNLTIALCILLTERHTPVPQPLGILGTIARPDGTGVLVVTTLVDSTLLGHDVGLYTVTHACGYKHLHRLNRHLDDVAVGQ